VAAVPLDDEENADVTDDMDLLLQADTDLLLHVDMVPLRVVPRDVTRCRRSLSYVGIQRPDEPGFTLSLSLSLAHLSLSLWWVR
jgi:hypothetical protein